MTKRTVIQPGRPDPCDLFVYAHLAAPSDVRQRVAETTDDAVVFELWGNGTAAYRQMLPAYGGTWPSYVAGLEAKFAKRLRKTCLTSWSAGSQFVKDVLLAAKGDLDAAPSAIVMLDGLYGAKPPGSKPGDGKVAADDALRAIAGYAAAAARGEGPVMVIFHSRIPTPYASSKECAEAVQRLVEAELGRSMAPDASLGKEALDGHAFVEALVLGDLHLVEFAGQDAKEHMREAHLYDEVWRRWIPWVSDAPPPAPAPTLPADITLAELALAVALEEEAAGVGETPPGSNRVKPAYWAGCTRQDPKTGEERLLKMLVGPWCAVAFQWASYEAARRLGLAEHEVADWLLGPVPHGRRVSVLETQNDFAARGLYHPAQKVRDGGYAPRPGDAVFFDRPGASAAAGLGHIARFVRRLDATTYETVGGNEAGEGDGDHGDRWRRKARKTTDKALRGFGEFPRWVRPVAAEQPKVQVVPPPAVRQVAALDASVYSAIDRMYEEWFRERQQAERQA